MPSIADTLPRWGWWALGGAAVLAGLAYWQRNALVNLSRLVAALPALSPARAVQLLPHVQTMLVEAGATTPARAAAMLAQVAHESGTFRYTQELASGTAYEGRRDLGNTQPGDGVRFKGRGWIQLTGRANYAAAGAALGLDLVGRPELAEQPATAARIAAWFWRTRGLNELADRGDFIGITRRINGGTNGLADRQERHRTALAALTLSGAPTS